MQWLRLRRPPSPHTVAQRGATTLLWSLFFIPGLPHCQSCNAAAEEISYICPCVRQSASSEEDEEEEYVEDEEEEEVDGEMAAGMSAAGTWQRQEDVLRRMNQQRNDILVRGSKRWRLRARARLMESGVMIEH